MPPQTPDKNSVIVVQAVVAAVEIFVQRFEKNSTMPPQTVDASPTIPVHAPDKNSVIVVQAVDAAVDIFVHRFVKKSAMPPQTVDAISTIPPHTPLKNSVIAPHAVDAAVEIFVQRFEKNSHKPPHIADAVVTIACQAVDRNCVIASHATMTAFLTASHKFTQNCLNSSEVFQRYMNPAPRAVINARMIPIGLAIIIPNTPESAVPTIFIPGISTDPSCIMLPIPFAMLPIAIRTGPTAPAISAIVAITFFVPSSRLFSLSTKSLIFCTISLIVGMNRSPMEIARSLSADFKIATSPPRLSPIVPAIFSAVPDVVSMMP